MVGRMEISTAVPIGKPTQNLWASESLYRSLRLFRDGAQTQALLTDCLRATPLVEAALRLLHKADNPESAERPENEELRRAAENSALAMEEIGKGSPTINAFAIVNAWTCLELGVDELLVAAVREGLVDAGIAKVKIDVSQLLGDEDDRVRLVAHQVSESTRASLRHGTAVFEAPLKLVGLSGGVDEEVAAGVYELQQVRNLHVHRLCHADKRFLEACPRFGLSLGERLELTNELADHLLASALAYFQTLFWRVLWGLPFDPSSPNGVAPYPGSGSDATQRI